MASEQNIKHYSSLAQIGITRGSETEETLANICSTLPSNSVLQYNVSDSSNQEIYPTQYGTFRVIKVENTRCYMEYREHKSTNHYMATSYNGTIYPWKKVSFDTHTHTVTHTPAGTVSTPTITVTPNTTTVNSITAVGTLPSLTYSEVKPSKITGWSAGSLPSLTFSAGTLPSASLTKGSGKIEGAVSTGPNRVVTLSHTHTASSLSFDAGTLPSASLSKGTLSSLTYEEVAADNITAWSAGSLPTKGSDTTVVTGIKSATSSQPTFSGTEATLATSSAKN